tara:strand:- start:1187 stop:1843 length:657 start_codon:yes stop_codon:yes gene_type:complete
LDKKLLNQQSQHWESNFSSKPEMFGLDPSYSAKKSLEIFKKHNIKNILELGAGLGRDTIYFAKNNIKVYALDFSPCAIDTIIKKSKKLGLDKLITAEVFDIRKDFSFIEKNFDCCYSHMLYCMALTESDLEELNKKIHLKLKGDGINIYTVRNTSDGDFKKGSHIGENLYEMNGFIVHFFSDEKIKKLLKGYKNLDIIKFDEGNFPRRLSMVINQKTS